MELSLPYGTSVERAALDWGRSLGVLDVADTPGIEDLGGALRGLGGACRCRDEA